MNKILRYKDIMEELYEEFSEIDPKSLDNLVKKGLYKMKSELYRGEELLVHSASSNLSEDYIPGWIKIYKDMTPDQYRSYIVKRDKRRKARDAKQNRTK
jgi:hypothetical protein